MTLITIKLLWILNINLRYKLKSMNIKFNHKSNHYYNECITNIIITILQLLYIIYNIYSGIVGIF
jgi:hypothetical protein